MERCSQASDICAQRRLSKLRWVQSVRMLDVTENSRGRRRRIDCVLGRDRRHPQSHPMPAGGLGFECKMGPVKPPLWAEFTRHLTTHVGFQGAPTAPGVNPLVAGSQEGPGDSVVGDAKDSCYLFTILVKYCNKQLDCIHVCHMKSTLSVNFLRR